MRPAGVAPTRPELVLERDPAWTAEQLGLAEFLELARAVRELLEGARPLDARDLALPGPTTDPGIDAADLAARTAIATARAARTRARSWRRRSAGGQPDALRAALARAAKLGVAAPPEAARRRARRARPPHRGGRGGHQRHARASPPCSATASGCCRA